MILRRMSAEQMSVNNTQTVLDNDDCAVDKDGPLYKPNEETSESGKCVIFKSIICYLFSKPALVCECCRSVGQRINLNYDTCDNEFLLLLKCLYNAILTLLLTNKNL